MNYRKDSSCTREKNCELNHSIKSEKEGSMVEENGYTNYELLATPKVTSHHYSAVKNHEISLPNSLNHWYEEKEIACERKKNLLNSYTKIVATK